MFKKVLIVLGYLLTSTFMYGQVAVKTNVPMDILRLPNLGLEVGLSKKVTLDVPFYYNPWKFSDDKQLKLSMVQPEVRYWLCDKFNGHFFGVHGMVGNYLTKDTSMAEVSAMVISSFSDVIGIWKRRWVSAMHVSLTTSMNARSVVTRWTKETRTTSALPRRR